LLSNRWGSLGGYVFTTCGGCQGLLSDTGLDLADLDRVAIGRTSAAPGGDREDAFPETDEASGRDQHDDEEDRSDQGVETRPDEADLLRVVVDDHEEERADPGALEPVQA